MSTIRRSTLINALHALQLVEAAYDDNRISALAVPGYGKVLAARIALQVDLSMLLPAAVEITEESEEVTQ